MTIQSKPTADIVLFTGVRRDRNTDVEALIDDAVLAEKCVRYPAGHRAVKLTCNQIAAEAAWIAREKAADGPAGGARPVGSILGGMRVLPVLDEDDGA